MATAVKVRKQSVVDTRKRTPRKFTVELSEGEVDFILGLLSQVGGHPTRSPRKYADRLYSTLAKMAGYRFDQTDAYKLLRSRPVMFEDYPAKPEPKRVPACPASLTLRGKTLEKVLDEADQIPVIRDISDLVRYLGN